MNKLNNLIRNLIKFKRTSKSGLFKSKSCDLAVKSSTNKVKYLKNKSKRPQTFSQPNNQQITCKQKSKTKQNESIRSDLYTLEQMYNDNSIYNRFEVSSSQFVYTNEVSLSSETSSLSSGSSLEIEQVNKSNLTISVESSFLDSVSIQKLDEQIKFRIGYLKHLSIQLNIQMPVHISMVEGLYDLKINQLKQEASCVLREFDQKVYNERESEKKNLNKILNTLNATKNFFKNYGMLRRRTKSADGSKSFQEQKHKNYYLLERENLERKYENKIRAMQFEILNSIHDIEVQLHEMSRQKERMLQFEQEIKRPCRHHCLKHRQQNSKTVQRVEQKRLNYSTEVSLQKRIRNRKQKQEQELQQQCRKRSNSTF